MSRRRTSLTAALAALAGSLALTPAAGATTFCVPAFFAGCPNSGGNVAQANLETAATTNASDGIKDTIRIQPGHVYTDTQSFEPTGTDDLDVIGGGESTVITSSNTNNVYVALLNTRGGVIKLSDLTIKAPASFPDASGAAMQIKDDVLESVQFVSDNPSSTGLSSIIDGATLTDVSFPDTGAGSFTTAFASNNNADIDINGAEIVGVVTGFSNGAADPDVEISNSYFETDPSVGQTGVSLSDGTATVRNSVFVTPKGTPISLFAFAGKSPFAGLDGVTMFDTNAAASAPVSVIANSTGTGTAVVTGSIARGFTQGFVRTATGSGPANVSIAYSNTLSSGSNSGPGSGSVTNGINADPLFTNPAAGNFTLQPTSPSIDAANPASTLTTDFLGTPRPLDGDGDSASVVDQGAFEYEPPDVNDPETLIDSGPGKKAKKGKPRFEFSADEQASFECSLVKAGKAEKFSACASPKSYELKRKRKTVKYTFAVRATDLAGNADSSPATKSFKVKKKP